MRTTKSVEVIAIKKFRECSTLTNTEILVLKALASMIYDAFPNPEREESVNGEFSLKISCKNITRSLTNHRGELTHSEKKHLLEMIEAAAKVMQFY